MLFVNRNAPQISHTESNPNLLDNIPLVNTTDLVLGQTGDLELTPSGDFRLSNTADSIISNLFRRLTTPAGGYERYFFNDLGELVEYDTGWSNALVNELSAPMTSNLIAWAVQKLQAVGEIDTRIKILSAKQEHITGQQTRIKIVYALGDNIARSTEIPLPR
jgi:hypothetical protein